MIKSFEGVKIDKEEWVGVKDDFWTPDEIDESVEGVIVGVNEHKLYGKQWNIVNKKKNLDFLTPYHKALQRLMEKVNVGDNVRIVYKGSKPTNKGNPIEIYSLWVKPLKRVDK